MRSIFLCLGLVAAAPAAAELGINVYGLSYHFDRERARELGIDNEFNPGLGLRYRVSQSERLQWIFDAGAYHDSGRNTALIAGAGALWRISPGWRLGGGLAVFKSDTYNAGDPFVAPLPLLAYEARSFTVNASFFPRLSEVNSVATLAVWFTWWP